MPAGFAFAFCADQIARYSNIPERREIDTRIIMPVSSPIVFQSMPLSASSWSSAPIDDHHRRAEQRHDRTIELVPDDDAVGDQQDDGRDHHRIEAEKDVRDCAMLGHQSPLLG